MRYDVMKQFYPWIDELFTAVQQQIDAGFSPDMAIRVLDFQLQFKVHAAHADAIRSKLMQFAQVVEDNRNFHDDPEQRHPIQCACCGSIETNGDSCSWCHSQLAG